MHQCDFLGEPEAGRMFLARIRRRPEFLAATDAVRAAVLIAPAVLFDHQAARAEAEGGPAAARRLIAAALAALDEVVPDRHDPTDAEQRLGDECARAILQRAIMLRRSHEVEHRSRPAAESPELRQAAPLIWQVILATCRPDHRVSALHQAAVCDLLAGRLDEADAKLLQCLARWDALCALQPNSAPEFCYRIAYEYRRLGNVCEARMAAATAAAEARRWYDDAAGRLDAAESVSRRWGNLRYVDELRGERERLDARFAARWPGPR